MSLDHDAIAKALGGKVVGTAPGGFGGFSAGANRLAMRQAAEPPAPTDSEMLDWLIANDEIDTLVFIRGQHRFYLNRESESMHVGSTPREAIAAAMRAEKEQA